MSRLMKFVVVLFVFSCAFVHPDEVDPSTEDFNSYWYGGQAEITTYDLKQARYGEVHEGESTLIFVTEDFLIEEQVKKESMRSDEFTSVLKLNKIDRFTTGLYDYSIMLSVFTPVDTRRYPHSLKSTFSSQDWCGQSFMQTNWKQDGYLAQVRSYFEAEGDKNHSLGEVLLEDALWTMARLEPKSLPVGELMVMPSSSHLRLKHDEMKPREAIAKMVLEVDDNDGERYIYSLVYDNGRSVELYLQTVFPYRILGWKETSKSGFGPAAKLLSTQATIKSTIKESYWSKNRKEDSSQRKLLKLGRSIIPSSTD